MGIVCFVDLPEHSQKIIRFIDVILMGQGKQGSVCSQERIIPVMGDPGRPLIYIHMQMMSLCNCLNVSIRCGRTDNDFSLPSLFFQRAYTFFQIWAFSVRTHRKGVV